MSTDAELFTERRSFLTRLRFGAGAFAAAMVGGAAQGQTQGQAQAPSKAVARFEPARHDKDDWLDEGGAKHRMVFDTFSPEAVALATLFGGNFLRVNQSDYGVAASDVSLVVVMRHKSVTFGYNDAMWAKYSAAFSKQSGYVDPKTNEAPKVNPHNVANSGRGSGVGQLEGLAKQGVQFAVCSSATRALAGTIARESDAKVDDVVAELTSNLISRGRMVPAGIVAVNRAQERGYTLASL